MTNPPLPPADAHAALTFINRTGQGIGTLFGCSCGWMPKKGSERGSTMGNSWLAHRRREKATNETGQAVYGEGPAKGYTFDEWYALEKETGKKVDPLGREPREPAPVAPAPTQRTVVAPNAAAINYLLAGLHARDWEGADSVELLCEWFKMLGVDVDDKAARLPVPNGRI